MSNLNAPESKQNSECLASAQKRGGPSFQTVQNLLAYIVADYWRVCADKDATGVVVALLAWRALGLLGDSGLGTTVGLVRGLITSVRRDHRIHLVELDAWTWWALGHPDEADVLWSRIVGAVASAERDGPSFVELAQALDSSDPEVITLSQAYSEFRGMPFDSDVEYSTNEAGERVVVGFRSGGAR